MSRRDKAVQLKELFAAVMCELNQEVWRALGYEQFCSPLQAVRRLADRFQEAEADLARLHDEFRMVAIELHVQKHYAASGIRWEDCEDCAKTRQILPEYKVEPNGFALCECGHSARTHSPCCVSACGCDEFAPRLTPAT